MKIPVTYLCWSCGSSITRYEETDIPIPAKEVWNLCPDCANKGVVNGHSQKSGAKDGRGESPPKQQAVPEISRLQETPICLRIKHISIN